MQSWRWTITEMVRHNNAMSKTNLVLMGVLSLTLTTFGTIANASPVVDSVAGGGQLSSVEINSSPSPSDPIPDGFVLSGNYKPTFYWVGMEQPSNAPRNKPLYGMDESVLVWVTERFWRKIRLEGTGRMLDGRVLNFGAWRNLPGGGRDILFREVDPYSPYGYGYEDRPLVPFRSIAVDPRKIPLDTEIYIPQARGAVLPDGAIHNGYFKAVDVGQAIQELRIDVFTAFGDQSRVFRANGLRNMVATPVYIRTSNR